jgi:hypothetical protein
VILVVLQKLNDIYRYVKIYMTGQNDKHY